jgi:hypothetical protein
VSVHLRASAEKSAEYSRYGVGAPPRTAQHALAFFVCRLLNEHSLFVQTASPSELHAVLGFAHETKYLRASYTPNGRSEHDVWGGWATGHEMGASVVAAVNLFVGGRAAALIGPDGSQWTGVLVATMRGPVHTRYADCGGSLITLALGKHELTKPLANRASLTLDRSIAQTCRWTTREAWGRQRTAPLYVASAKVAGAAHAVTRVVGGALGWRQAELLVTHPRTRRTNATLDRTLTLV